MKSIYTVAQVNSYIKNMFAQDFMLQSVYVKGEVSNCKYHTTGHIYFTLKDEKGTISCVMFAGNRSGLAFKLQEGQQVIAGGSVAVYERDGKYQLYARDIVLDGAGLLYERFEQLKRELEEQGLFSPVYKQPIPRFVRTLGIVTAPTGAAVQDMIQVSLRRNPYLQLIVYPAFVQGEQAKASIISGIKTLEAYGVDLMIVGRGGGSIEDLWAFNEPEVAQAIFDCTIPIISAVGHETDTTIADFVADLRAPTPSAAAELAVYEYRSLQDTIDSYGERLQRLMNQQIKNKQNQIQQFAYRLRYLNPLNQIREKRTRLIQMEESLQLAMNRRLERKRHQLALYLEQMKGMSPLLKLNQGYSFVSDEEERTIHDIEAVVPGQKLNIYVKNGLIHAQVLKKEKIEWEKNKKS